MGSGVIEGVVVSVNDIISVTPVDSDGIKGVDLGVDISI